MTSNINENGTYQLSVTDEEQSIRLCLNVLRTGLTAHKLTIQPISQNEEEDEEDGLGLPARDILCGPELTSSFKTEGRAFKNQVVGRYANRLPSGKSLVQDLNHPDQPQIELDLEKNETFEGDPERGNCLHSGQQGYDLRDFEHVSKDSKIVKEFESASDHGLKRLNESSDRLFQKTYFHLHSPSGDQGFPESIEILATVSLEILPVDEDEDEEENYIGSKTGKKRRIGRAGFSLRAKLSEPDQQAAQRRNAATPINLTWHTGYILNDFQTHPIDSDGIHQHKLWIDSAHHLAVDQTSLPTGEIQSNQSAGIDFSVANPLSENEIKAIKKTMPASGFDHCFLFKQSGRSSGSSKESKTNEEQPRVVLRSPKDDLILLFYTNQTAVQCYSANYFDGRGSRKRVHCSDHHPGGYKKQEALYLEFQQPSGVCTNATLQKNLQRLGDRSVSASEPPSFRYEDSHTILYPSQVYSNWFWIDIFI